MIKNAKILYLDTPCRFFHAYCEHDENAPSAGTERIDHIGKCQSSLWDAFSQARLPLVTTVHDLLTLLCSALHSGPSRSSMIWDVALLHVISHTHTVRYRTVPTLRRDSQNLR